MARGEGREATPEAAYEAIADLLNTVDAEGGVGQEGDAPRGRRHLTARDVRIVVEHPANRRRTPLDWFGDSDRNFRTWRLRVQREELGACLRGYAHHRLRLNAASSAQVAEELLGRHERGESPPIEAERLMLADAIVVAGDRLAERTRDLGIAAKAIFEARDENGLREHFEVLQRERYLAQGELVALAMRVLGLAASRREKSVRSKQLGKSWGKVAFAILALALAMLCYVVVEHDKLVRLRSELDAQQLRNDAQEARVVRHLEELRSLENAQARTTGAQQTELPAPPEPENAQELPVNLSEKNGPSPRPRRRAMPSFIDAMSTKPPALPSENGMLASGDIEQVMNRKLNSFFQCVSAALGAKKEIQTVTIEMAISGSGSVVGATVHGGDKEFERCVVDILRRVSFPRFDSHRMGATYSFDVD